MLSYVSSSLPSLFLSISLSLYSLHPRESSDRLRHKNVCCHYNKQTNVLLSYHRSIGISKLLSADVK